MDLFVKCYLKLHIDITLHYSYRHLYLLAYATTHRDQLNFRPSVGWKMSTGQGAAAALGKVTVGLAQSP